MRILYSSSGVMVWDDSLGFSLSTAFSSGAVALGACGAGNERDPLYASKKSWPLSANIRRSLVPTTEVGSSRLTPGLSEHHLQTHRYIRAIDMLPVGRDI